MWQKSVQPENLVTCIHNQEGPRKEMHFGIKRVSLATKYNVSKGLIRFSVTYMPLGVKLFDQNSLY